MMGLLVRDEDPSDQAGESLRQRLQLLGQCCWRTGIDIGQERISLCATSPHHHAEPALFGGQRARPSREQGSPVRSKPEERERVESVDVDEHGSLTVENVTDGGP